MQNNQPKISKNWFIDSHTGDIKQVYHFDSKIGSGGFGVVYAVTHRESGKNNIIHNFLS